MVEYRDRLIAAMKAANVSASKLAEGLNASYQAVKKVIDGKSSAFNAPNNALAARLLGVSSDWLALGEGDMKSGAITAPTPSRWPFASIPEEQILELPDARLRQLEGAIALAIAQLNMGVQVTLAAPRPMTPSSAGVRSNKAGSLTNMDMASDEFPMPDVLENQAAGSGNILVAANVTAGVRIAANDSFEPVPELADVRLAAGDGIENHTEDQTGVIQFRRSFLRSVGADVGKACVVYAKGDSMEPVIKDGAALLLVPNENLTLRDLAAGGVYAINYDGKMIVKTVTKDKLTGRWVARSFNPAYPDIPLENGHPARVLGQVVWAGAKLRDDEAGQWIRS